jgi:hypothetical protein
MFLQNDADLIKARYAEYSAQLEGKVLTREIKPNILQRLAAALRRNGQRAEAPVATNDRATRQHASAVAK